MRRASKLAIRASDAEPAQAARVALEERYGSVPLTEADVIIALGADGFMLLTIIPNKAVINL